MSPPSRSDDDTGDHKLPRYNETVIGGPQVADAAKYGFSTTGVIHRFHLPDKFKCGHTGEAQEYRGLTSVRTVCCTCLKLYTS